MGVGYLAGQGGGGSNIKSIQRGMCNLGAYQTASVTINQVDLTKAIVLIDSYGSPESISGISATGKFTNATTIFIKSETGETQISWVVVEFANVKSMQRGTLTISVNETDGYTTANKLINISSVDTNKSIFIARVRGDSTYSYSGGYSGYTHSFISKTQISVILKKDTGGNRFMEWQVIEFN